MNRIIIPGFLFGFLLFSCQPVSPDYNLQDTNLDRLISEAAAGSPEKLYELGKSGGEGSWFALAAAAGDAGFPQLSRELQIRSIQDDAAPFGVRSLTDLLIAEPGALKHPLNLLGRAEKRYGTSPAIRRAKISVLLDLERYNLLAGEMERFTGEPWEAPVLAARLQTGDADPALLAQTERFILQCPDPGAMEFLAGTLPANLNEAYGSLFEARLSFSRGLFSEALDGYRLWLGLLASSADSCNLEAPPPVFREIVRAAGETGKTLAWAGILATSALEYNGPKRFGAAFSAGELFRGLGDYPAAVEAFTLAAESVPGGLERDRALWQKLGLVLRYGRLSGEEEAAAFAGVFGLWENPDRFSDRLEEFLHRRVVGGEWGLIEKLFTEWGVRWPDDVRSEAAWILAFAVREGRLAGSVRDYLETAAESSPLSWPGLRAAGLLNYEIGGHVPDTAAGDSRVELNDDEKIIRLFLNWRITSRASEAVQGAPDLYSGAIIRQVAAALAESEPRTSIRVAGLLYGKPGYVPNRVDLQLRYPLPYAALARDIALENGLPTEVFLGLIRTESAWDTRALSRSGAQGLAQFMPATWEEWAGRLRLDGNPDPFDPETNLIMAAAYLNWLHNREWTFGWTDVLASYNAGGGWVRTWRRDRPGLGDDLFSVSLPVEEPRSYIFKVLSAATLYGYLYEGESPNSLHKKWGLEMIEVY